MCSINFILDKKGILDDLPIRNMVRATHHRGPDHDGFSIQANNGKTLFLGSSRLAILDLSKNAHQPFISEDENHIMVFNGEIYNFHDLKNILIRKGIRFRSSSDTEVLLYALAEFGTHIIEKLNGMFAFVYYDKNKDILITARDIAGMKPVYYYENELYLIISSEIKGILASGLVKKELNENQIPHYLKFKYACKPYTFFKDIMELEEGHMLKYEESGSSISRYSTNVEQGYQPLDHQQILVKTEELLYDTFLRHYVADVPIGLFLSGGVDSTLLLAMAQREKIALPTFSIVHEDKSASFGTQDHHFSRLAVKHFGNPIDHHEIPAEISMLGELDEIILHMDQPVGDSAAILTWYLSRFARNSVKSVWSGAGADEWFAGYHRHQAYHSYLKYYPTFKNMVPLFKWISKGLPTGVNHPFRNQFRLINKFFLQIDKNPIATFENFTSLEFTIASRQPMDDDTLFHSIQKLFGWALKKDRDDYLISDVLKINDLMAMKHGLEVRMPYLDKELTGFINTLDPLELIRPGRKWILKSLLSRYGGEKFCNRNKEGFGLPFGHWIRQQELSHLTSVFNEKIEIIHKFVPSDQVRQIFWKHINKKADYTAELWTFLVLANWLKLNGFS